MFRDPVPSSNGVVESFIQGDEQNSPKNGRNRKADRRTHPFETGGGRETD